MDWSWWAVFTPLWLLHVGQLVSWGASQALAMYLARRLEDNEGATEVAILVPYLGCLTTHAYFFRVKYK